MKQRKVFLGIPVPAAVAKRLAHKVAPYHHLPIRFTKERNFHITLAFIGHIGDESVAEVCSRVEEVCATLEPFDVLLERITLVPEQGKDAEMLWYAGEASEELRQLHEELSRALGTFSASSKAFAPHVTLGRVREHKWQALDEIPEIEGKFVSSIPVDSVTVFESIFEPHVGLTYQTLGDYPLSGEMETQ